MATQESFDAQIQRANAALQNIGTQIAAEGQEIRDFIAQNPSIDTSALEGVVANLETVGASVEGIFTAPESGAAGTGEAGGDASTGTTGDNPDAGGSGDSEQPGSVDSGSSEPDPASDPSLEDGDLDTDEE